MQNETIKTNSIIHTPDENAEYYNRARVLIETLKDKPAEAYSIDSLLYHTKVRNEAFILSHYDGFSERKRLLLQLLHAEAAIACDDVYETLKECGYTEEELDIFPLL